MTRMILALGLLSCMMPSWALAQDMPLSQILPDKDRGWKSGAPLPLTPAAYHLGEKDSLFSTSTPDRKFTYVTFPGDSSVYLYRGDDKPVSLKLPVKEPTGMAIWSGGGTIVVADAADKYLWAFRIDADGQLVDGDRYYALRVPKGVDRSEAMGMTIDPMGRLYVATSQGVQVFDPTGRMCGVLLPAGTGTAKQVLLEGNVLSVTHGDKRFSRELKADGLMAPIQKK